MKISSVKSSVKVIEQGMWVDEIPEMGDLRLRCRGAGNKEWRKLQNRLIQAVPRTKRVNGLDPEEQDRINATLLSSCGLLEWDRMEDDAGKAIPYSKELAAKYLADPEMSRFRDAVLWACGWVAEQTGAEVETAAKN